MAPDSQSQESIPQSDENTDMQAITQEQLSDMYFAGTSDGLFQLENEKLQVPNTKSE